MSRSKKDILDTERMLERLAITLAQHAIGDTKFAYKADECRRDAASLRRISMTLHRWHELECNGNIQRSERPTTQDKPYRVSEIGGERYSYDISDREAGALKRLKTIMARYPKLQAYVQGDPRGCALYILKPGDVPEGGRAESYYSRGLAVHQ